MDFEDDTGINTLYCSRRLDLDLDLNGRTGYLAGRTL